MLKAQFSCQKRILRKYTLNFHAKIRCYSLTKSPKKYERFEFSYFQAKILDFDIEIALDRHWRKGQFWPILARKFISLATKFNISVFLSFSYFSSNWFWLYLDKSGLLEHCRPKSGTRIASRKCQFWPICALKFKYLVRLKFSIFRFFIILNFWTKMYF